MIRVAHPLHRPGDMDPLDREQLAAARGGVDLSFLPDINWPLWTGVVVGAAAWAERRRLQEKLKLRRKLP